MNVPFYIARRYLFSKKSHNAINIISMVCVCGVVIATIAVVCALSVFNGFNDLVAGMFSSFDPELKISPRTGKVFDPTTAEFQKVKQLPDIAYFGEVLQDNALVRYHDRQDIAIIKGVDDNFSHLTQIDSILIDGSFILKDEVADYATLGVGLSSKLGAKPGFASPLEIYVPKRDEKVNLSNPASSFNQEYAYIGGVFLINQQVYDEGYMILPLSLVRQLLKYDKEVSSIELKLADGADISSVRKQIKAILGDQFTVQDRYEQQEASFKMMQVEKWMTFLILSFILAIALFNVVGSLSMLMIEKKDDVRTLRNMGASDSLIRRIFLFEGWMISGFGALIGIVIGLVLCLLQQTYGIIKLGQTAGAFIIDAYPVRVIFTDLLTAFITVAAIGFMAAWYPVHYLGKKWFN
ncbi:ABC transporter permease [Parabacteroides faecis]|uniref:ABC transporter permease n=1 Tax=Parabacteroides TaxID=375288 RepID=UPI000EFF21EA|nr:MULTISPECIES: ABC transporter permease [Parabacteroides]MBC8619847.1 ABC transporter permease [Parabacteroides faecis]RHS00651.1 ABC transporter permease [Parabacteroides sp. AF14-59]